MNENEIANVRKLATIARIEEIKSIEEAESIEHARVRGWWVVVRKGEFKVNDLCIYCETDSVFPDGLAEEKALEWKTLQKELSKASTDDIKFMIKSTMVEISKLNTIPQFEFLRGSKFRIKTKRIFGSISQGICFPISILTAHTGVWLNAHATDDFETIKQQKGFELDLTEDTNVTELLGVTQYIPPDPAIMGGDAKGDMQNLGLLISDEERIENLSGKYEALKALDFCFYKTEKLDGTSFCAVLKNGVFSVTGRTIEFKVPDPETPINQLNVYWKMAKKLDLENKMREFVTNFPPGLNLAIQGELIGEGIQGNIYKLKGQKVYFYNTFDIDLQTYWSYDAFIDLITKSLGLETIPILDKYYKLPEKAEDMLLEADKTYSVLNPKQLIEGFVYIANEQWLKPDIKITRSSFQRLSFKAKSRTFDMNKG